MCLRTYVIFIISVGAACYDFMVYADYLEGSDLATTYRPTTYASIVRTRTGHLT